MSYDSISISQLKQPLPKPPSIIWNLFLLFKWDISSAMIFKCISDLLQFTNPQLLKYVYLFVQFPLVADCFNCLYYYIRTGFLSNSLRIRRNRYGTVFFWPFQCSLSLNWVLFSWTTIIIWCTVWVLASNPSLPMQFIKKQVWNHK